MADAPGQVGPPPQVNGICAAPALVARAYTAAAVWVTVGCGGHVKFWCWRPDQPEPLACVKGKFDKVTAGGSGTGGSGGGGGGGGGGGPLLLAPPPPSLPTSLPPVPPPALLALPVRPGAPRRCPGAL